MNVSDFFDLAQQYSDYGFSGHDQLRAVADEPYQIDTLIDEGKVNEVNLGSLLSFFVQLDQAGVEGAYYVVNAIEELAQS